MEEIHLFIIWENARYKETELMDIIQNNFNIIQKRYITWSKNSFSNNLSRFYGTKLPNRSAKEQHIGNGEFVLVIVEDRHPQYDFRETSGGNKLVNTNMFDIKEKLRALTGGGHKIHGTISLKETNHDLTLLIGKNIDDFLSNNIEKVIKEERNLEGEHGWKSVEQMFYVLNNCTEYVIMRNYESLPEELYVTEHNDIDVLCENKIECQYILNVVPVFKESYRVHYYTLLEDEKKVFFDLRYVGDNYYCENLEQDMLKNKEYNSKGFYVLNSEYYYYTLLYHAYIQKPKFKKDYQVRLKKMKNNDVCDQSVVVNILEKWLFNNSYYVSYPFDKSVYFNEKHVSNFSVKVYQPNTTIKLLEKYYSDIIEENNNKIFSYEKENKRLMEENTNLKSTIHKIMNSKRMKLFKILDEIKRR